MSACGRPECRVASHWKLLWLDPASIRAHPRRPQNQTVSSFTGEFFALFFSLETFCCGNRSLFVLYYAVAQLSPPPPSPPSHRLGESLPRLLVCMRRFVHWLQRPTKCCSQVHNISTYTVTRMGVLNSTKNVTLCPGDERDSLFDRHQLHTLQLHYDLKLTAKATVTLAVPSLHGVLYVFKPKLHKSHTRNYNISNKKASDGVGSGTSHPSLRICGRSATQTDA